jgi:hypothetical protein
MEKVIKKKKLSLLVVFAGIAYVYLFLTMVKNNLDDFLMGFTEGYQDETKHLSKDASEQVQPDVYFMHVKPKSGIMCFPDSLVNLKSGETVNTRYYEMRVATPSNSSQPTIIKVYKGINIFLTIIVLVIFIFIPVKFYQLMKSFKKEIVFDKRNIQKIRLIGKSLILLFLISELLNYLSFEINSVLFNFSNYKLVQERPEVLWLLFGIVVLIVAEIISRGSVLKEEQELTI